MQRAIALFALLLLSDCGSSLKVQFYTLSVSPGLSAEHLRISAPVQVSAVHIPDSLDRREMVSVTGPNEVEVSDRSRWSAPLGPMTRLVLSEDLAALLPPGKVIMPDAPIPPATSKIVVTLARFGRDASGGIVLHGSWTLLTDSGKTKFRRDFVLQQPAAEGANSEAASMSNLLGQLATRIASALERTGVPDI